MTCLDCGAGKVRARQLCGRCYDARRYAGLDMPPTARKPFEPIEGERWLPVVGWEGRYEVSDYGRVRSEGGLLRLNTRPDGRLQANLNRAGVQRMVKVHRLVLEAFVGPCLPSTEGCHNDGNVANNHVSNLRWDTRSANNLDSVRHGTHHLASRTHCLRNHPLAGRNLKLSTLARGRRECWACARAAALVRHDVAMGRVPRSLQQASDLAYAKIMETALPEDAAP